MIQDPRIIDNIKKLKELGMSDKDIKDNLIKMNLAPQDCDELIAAASVITENKELPKEQKTQEKETKKKEKTQKEEPAVIETQKTEIKELPDNLFDEGNNIGALKEEIPFSIKDDFSEIPDITKGLDIDQLSNTDIDFNNEETTPIAKPEESKKQK